MHVKENYPVKSTLLTRTFTIDCDGTFCTNGWRSVYLALPKVETPDVAWDVGVLRKVFADAGAHIWIDTPEIVAAGRGYLMVHAASDGEKTIRLPSRCDVKEVYDACPPLKSVIEFKDVFKKGETRIYQLRGLHRRGEWGDTVDDPKAGDGKAIKIFNTHFQWCVQLPMDRIAFEAGRKYRPSVRVRVDKARDGEAFCAGIFSKAASLVRRGIEVRTADVQDGEYRWYDVISWVPAPDEYFWFAPGRFDTDGKSAVNGVYIDKIKFSLAEWT